MEWLLWNGSWNHYEGFHTVFALIKLINEKFHSAFALIKLIMRKFTVYLPLLNSLMRNFTVYLPWLNSLWEISQCICPVLLALLSARCSIYGMTIELINEKFHSVFALGIASVLFIQVCVCMYLCVSAKIRGGREGVHHKLKYSRYLE